MPTGGAVSNVSTPVIDAAEERSPTFIDRARVSIVVSDAESAPIIAEWTNGRGHALLRFGEGIHTATTTTYRRNARRFYRKPSLSDRWQDLAKPSVGMH